MPDIIEKYLVLQSLNSPLWELSFVTVSVLNIEKSKCRVKIVLYKFIYRFLPELINIHCFLKNQ